jgi:hypothetical protein
VRKATFLVSVLCVFGSILSAATILVPGTPNSSDNSTGTPTGLSPKFGTLVNFDELMPNSLFDPAAYAGLGVNSIAAMNSTTALSAVPYSGQSQPNYIGPANFSNIDILIALEQTTSEIGVGLLAGSSNTFTLVTLGSANNVLGNYTVTVPSTGVTAFNGYYAIQDSNSGVKALEIIGNGGIDDLQFASATSVPEPVSSVFAGLGLALVTASQFFRRKN